MAKCSLFVTIISRHSYVCRFNAYRDSFLRSRLKRSLPLSLSLERYNGQADVRFNASHYGLTRPFDRHTRCFCFTGAQQSSAGCIVSCVYNCNCHRMVPLPADRKVFAELAFRVGLKNSASRAQLSFVHFSQDRRVRPLPALQSRSDSRPKLHDPQPL
jgi:hypothetical protein